MSSSPACSAAFAPDAGPTRSPGAAAIGRYFGIARRHPYLADINADGGGDDLRQDRFRALALFRYARQHGNAAVRVEAHGGAVHRRDARATNAVHERRGVRQLDETGKPDAAMDALGAQLRLFRPQPVVLHRLEQQGERFLVRQPLKRHVGVVAVR